MRTLLSVAAIVVMAALFARAAALVLDDALIGAMAGILLFLPLIVLSAPFLETRPAPVRLSSRR